MGVTWPSVGRREELELVEQALAAGISGMVLAGAAGVGKTRLAREALGAAEAKGWVARWAVATQAAASIPFRALAHFLPAAVGGESRLEMLRAAAAGLVRGARSSRLALGVDDAHLLDDASAALVHQLAATGTAFGVVTVRSVALAPDAVIALWKDGLAERLEVQAAGGSGVVAVVPGVTALCAYFSPGDQHQHVLAADATGTLHETWFIGGGRAMDHNIRGRVPATVALAGYDGTADRFEHVVAASGDGTLHELFWTP